nr:hypothetical protein OG546_17940 [Streptomyces antimycoticus]
MTALAHEPCPTVDDGLSPAAETEVRDLDEVLWQAWKAMELPEGRVPYGTDAVIPDGPAKGFVIGEAVVGP